MTGPVVLEARGLQKRFGDTPVLQDFSLAVPERQIVALIGKSGAGKSTALRCLNLLERPDAGTLLVDGQTVPTTLTGKALSAHRANVGMVFQHLHLFGHLSALDNIVEAPVHVLGQPRAEAEARARDLLAQVGLQDRAGARVQALSGGQRQRVAIARALCMAPRVLLLDEVTSALDVENIADLQALLHELSDAGTTMVMVTHDLAFVRDGAHRICFMDGGAIIEDGPAHQLLDAPQSERLQAFLGAAGR